MITATISGIRQHKKLIIYFSDNWPIRPVCFNKINTLSLINSTYVNITSLISRGERFRCPLFEKFKMTNAMLKCTFLGLVGTNVELATELNPKSKVIQNLEV